MLAYGFSAFFAGVLGLITALSIPGDQIVLVAASGLLSGSGVGVLLISTPIPGK